MKCKSWKNLRICCIIYLILIVNVFNYGNIIYKLKILINLGFLFILMDIFFRCNFKIIKKLK